MKGNGCISNLEDSITLSNRERMGDTGKRIARVKPFGKGERDKNHSAFITEIGKKSGKVSL